jgi:cytochrome c oxidase subunit 2
VPAALALALSALVVACGGDDTADAPPVTTAPLTGAAQRGATLAAESGCMACHSADGSRATGPGWAGLAGSEVELDDGTVVTADRTYLERAIVDPRAQVRAGYANIMPSSYRFTDDELDDLLAFLEAIGADQTG